MRSSSRFRFPYLAHHQVEPNHNDDDGGRTAGRIPLKKRYHESAYCVSRAKGISNANDNRCAVEHVSEKAHFPDLIEHLLIDLLL